MATANGRVLLVDDDADVREAIRDVLSDEGYETIEAANGRAALDYLRVNPPPPLILLDWNMAPINGPEFMAEAAKDPVLSRVPVVLLTADTRAPEKSKNHGFAGYLEKPVAIDDLCNVVSRYCGGRLTP